jgi:hypothetical protein
MLDPLNFSKNIQAIVEDMGLDYMDAICYYCESNDIEIEIAAQMLTPKILAGVESEAKGNRLLKDNRMYAQLPI